MITHNYQEKKKIFNPPKKKAHSGIKYLVGKQNANNKIIDRNKIEKSKHTEN